MNSRSLSVDYTNTTGAKQSVSLNESQHGWVSSVRVGKKFASPASVAGPLISALPDIQSIERVAFIDEQGHETVLPE